MKKYQDNFPHTETECSGTFCMFTYIDNLGGVKKPRGVQRGPARSHLHRVYRVLDSMCKIYKIKNQFFVLLLKEKKKIDNFLTTKSVYDTIFSSS